MVKQKEDRSGWVAVEPEFETGASVMPPVKSKSTAFQIFQREMTSVVRDEMIVQGMDVSVGNLTRAVSERFKSLDPVKRALYDDRAREDASRFARESHMRNIAVMGRQERMRQERNEIIQVSHGGRTSRSAHRKEKKRDQRANKKATTKSQKPPKKKRSSASDEASSSGSEFREEASVRSDGEESVNSDGDSEGSFSEHSDSSDSDKKPKKKAPPRQVSQEVLEKRELARIEKEQKEQYIEERQSDLRKDRAEQAKRRLDFLLKQSDIFSHFGNVKEDKQKLPGGRRSARSNGAADTPASNSLDNGDGVRRRADPLQNGAEESTEVNEAELEEVGDHAATFLTSQPSTIGFGKMRDYQLEGLNWMIRLQENGVNGVLADEMGLGKTLQSISVLVYMLEYTQCNGPHLIVVPKSTLSNWMNEIDRWAPTLNAVRFHGTKEEREDLAKNVLQPGQRDEERQWHVVVTTYEVCNIDRQALSKFAWSYLIIDEAHRLKNEASTFSQTVRSFETRYRLLLTGTPLQNNLHELWALLNFLVPDVFASAEQFDEWFNLDIEDADEKNKLISQLHKILRPFMLRRLKADVEKSLPPKHETILFTGMSTMQKKLYKDILMRDIDMLQGGAGSKTAILNIVMQLRKCAGHPYLFPGVEDRSLPPLGEHVVENCGKLVVLDKLLMRLKERGHRVLLFTQMTRILDILEDYMWMRRYQYCRIDGNTSYDVREESIDKFNAPDSDKFIFLLSTRAGGLGINLQTANIVILYDSDWNPQADLQAQDRAHRIGQKKEVQVFRLVTEHTIEEKVVERAQQKLKLDAMVVQQGRLKDKDSLSSEQMLEAVRFGADKVFKSKDSSITDDDIDMILDQGKKKTQEMNEKLQNAEKGDMLDFKLDGGISTQTFEGIDYSQRGKDMDAVKAAQVQAELLGIMDMGKRERRTVANYNEDQLYKQQIALQQGGRVKVRKKKETRLPKYLRLPRMEEWQMFDRDALHALQEMEENAFRALPEEQQKLATTGVSTIDNKADEQNIHCNGDDKAGEDIVQSGPVIKSEGSNPSTLSINVNAMPPLLSEEQQAEKKKLLAEGFADWGRHHYSAFIKASAKMGRDSYAKIAEAVGKPRSSLEDFAAAFWDENIGKNRFSEHEYERVVKLIERGEKKLHDIKSLERCAGVLLSLFENPWVELEFSHANCKDKMFTMHEDRHLLCWAHKYGYGQWGAVKMAIRRSQSFKFDYFLRSLPVEAVGRRCEQLMRAAEREVEFLEKKAREEAGIQVNEEKTDGIQQHDSAIQGHDINEKNDGELVSVNDLPHVVLPMNKEVQAKKRAKEREEKELELKQFAEQVEEVENEMQKMQSRLKTLNEYSREETPSANTLSSIFPDEMLSDLVNLVAKSGHTGIMTIANDFSADNPGRVSKRLICSKIEEVARKEKKEEEGDTRAVWHILPEFVSLIDVDTLRYLRKAKTDKLDERKSGNQKKTGDDAEDVLGEGKSPGAVGPEGEFVPFPDYDESEEPRENKKAFTHFCNGTRREVKASLDPIHRKDKSRVNRILKDQWFALSEEDMLIWKTWENWDAKRYAHDLSVFKLAQKNREKKRRVDHDRSLEDGSSSGISIPKKQKSHRVSHERTGDATNGASALYSIPKKKK